MKIPKANKPIPYKTDEQSDLVLQSREDGDWFAEYEYDEAEDEYQIALYEGRTESRPWKRLSPLPPKLASSDYALLDALAEFAVEQALAELGLEMRKPSTASEK